MQDNNKISEYGEEATSRIDVYSPTRDHIFTIDGYSPATWMENMGRFGYVLQKTGRSADYRITILREGILKIVFRGPDYRDENKKIIEYWVDFTKLSINGKDIISSAVSVWHSKSFEYTLEVEKGSIINIYAEWKKSKTANTNIHVQRNTSVLNSGEDNTILLSEGNNAKLAIYVYGNHNSVIMDKAKWFAGNIYIGTRDCPVNNCSVEIGEDSTSNGVSIRVLEDNSKVSIGKDCQFSSDIWIYCSDTHTITDMDGNINNIGKFVTIGNHVWVGMNAFIGKNTTISDDCIVGMCSCVTGKKVYPTNSVIAGNPAKIVKSEIKWNRDRPKQYMQKCSEQKAENNNL